jgi:hypothetical protein
MVTPALANGKLMIRHRPRRLDINPDLIDRAKVAARKVAETELTGGILSFRELARLAVDRELDAVVALLGEAGITSRPEGRARPRELDDATWDELGVGAERVAVDRIGLLRACLERLSRRES